MICPNCKSSVDAGDRFCPKCGGAVAVAAARPQAAAGMPAAPQVVDARAQQGTRVAEMRVPIAEGGRKFIGLTTAARMLIRFASIVRILGIVVALLTTVSLAMYVSNSGGSPIGYLLAVLWGIAVGVGAWMLALMLTIFGELMYVIIDIEDDLRRHT